VADDERNGRTPAPVLTAATSAIMPPAGPTLETIVIIVVCAVMGTIVLVLVILVVLYCRNRLCRDKRRRDAQVHGPEQLQEPFISMH